MTESVPGWYHRLSELPAEEAAPEALRVDVADAMRHLNDLRTTVRALSKELAFVGYELQEFQQLVLEVCEAARFEGPFSQLADAVLEMRGQGPS